jgi:hypothetical protein
MNIAIYNTESDVINQATKLKHQNWGYNFNTQNATCCEIHMKTGKKNNKNMSTNEFPRQGIRIQLNKMWR